MQGLPSSVRKSLKGSGIEKLHPIQERVFQFLSTPSTFHASPIGALMGLGGDAIINAPTGCGKTLAYALPIVKHILTYHKTNRGVQAIILVPSHELVNQVVKTVEQLFIHVKPFKSGGKPFVTGLRGSSSWIAEVRSLFKDGEAASVIVATSARFLEHLRWGGLVEILSHLDFIVLDEADLLIEKALEDLTNVIAIVDSHRQGGLKRIRKILSSATVSEKTTLTGRIPLQCPRFFHLDENASSSDQSARLPERLDCFLWCVSGADVDKLIEQDIIDIKTTIDRDQYLWHLLRDFHPKWMNDGQWIESKHRRLKDIPKAIIFVNTNEATTALSQRINKHYEALRITSMKEAESITIECYPKGISGAIHPNMAPQMRRRVLDDFMEDRCPILVSTDVAARGIDDLDVELVISYEAPSSIANLIHRSGRTARADAYGSAVHLTTRRDYRRLMKQIESNATELAAQILDYYDVLKMSYLDEDDYIEETPFRPSD